MALPKRYAKKQAKATRRRRLNAKARHLRQQQEAQHAIDTLHQALHDLGLPDHLVVEIEGRLKAQKKLLSKVFGLIFKGYEGRIANFFQPSENGPDSCLLRLLHGQKFGDVSDFTVRMGPRSDLWG